MFSKEELEQLLERVGSKIEIPLRIYMIGGCALSFKGLKEKTKDIDVSNGPKPRPLGRAIREHPKNECLFSNHALQGVVAHRFFDIIVKSKEDFDIFDKSMNKNGFKSMNDGESDFYLTALAVYMKEDSRIDVFLKQVGKMLFLTESMIQRSEKYKQCGKLDVYLISNEDIFLFKTMTSRKGDIYDCDRIMRRKIDYNIVYDEIVEQSKEEGKRWFFWVYENLCKLEDHNGIRVPIKNKVFQLVKLHWNERPSDFMDDVPEKAKHIPEKRLLKDLSQ